MTDDQNKETLIAGAGDALIDGYGVAYCGRVFNSDPLLVELSLVTLHGDTPNGTRVKVPIGGEVTIGESVWIVTEIWVNPNFVTESPDGLPLPPGGNPGTVTLVRKR